MSAVPKEPPIAASAPEAIVQAEGLSKTFDVSPPWLNRVLERKGRSVLHAVDGVTFDIQRGETLSLVGESGCGKSTVARLLVGLYAPSAGRVRFFGHDLSELNTEAGRSLRQKLQMIFQDPYASLNPRWRVADIIAEPLRAHGLMKDPAQVMARVDEASAAGAPVPGRQGEVPAPVLRRPAAAAVDRARAGHQAGVPRLRRTDVGARRLRAGPGAEPDEGPAARDGPHVPLHLAQPRGRHHISDRVGVMYLGRIVELATRRTLFATPRHPYTRLLLDAIPDLEMSGRARTPVGGEVPNPLNPPSGCTFHPRCPHANERCRREAPVLKVYRHAGGESQAACHAVEEGRI